MSRLALLFHIVLWAPIEGYPVLMCQTDKTILGSDPSVIMGHQVGETSDRLTLLTPRQRYKVGDVLFLTHPVVPSTFTSLLYAEATPGLATFVGATCGHDSNRAPIVPAMALRLQAPGVVEVRGARAGGYGLVARTQPLYIHVGETGPCAALRRAGVSSVACGAQVKQSRFRLWNKGCESLLPLLVVRPQNAWQVRQTVEIAAAFNTSISTRSGGHSYYCASMKRGSIHIDLRDMKKRSQVFEDPQDPTKLYIQVETGNTFQDLADDPRYSKVHFVRPEVNGIGVGGWYTHGGAAPNGDGGQYGWGNQSVLAMDLVVASGDLLRLDAKSKHQDLWRAVRVAGSAFGVATSLTIQVWPNAPLPVRIYAFPSLSAPLKLYHAAAKLQTNTSRDDWSYDAPFSVHIMALQQSVTVTGLAIHLPLGRFVTIKPAVGSGITDADMDAWVSAQGVRPLQLLTLQSRATLRALGDWESAMTAWSDAVNLAVGIGASLTSYGVLVTEDAAVVDALAERFWDSGKCLMLEVTSFGARTWVDGWCQADPKVEPDLVERLDPSYQKYKNLGRKGVDPSRYWGDALPLLRSTKLSWDPSHLFDGGLFD